MSEQVFDKVSKGKLELLKTGRKVYSSVTHLRSPESLVGNAC